MNIDHMRAYVTLANCLNFTKAANELFITQPTLSKYIFRIEEELGVQLFIRSTQNVELTETGKFIHKEFERIITQYALILDKVSLQKVSDNCSINIGMLYYAIEEYVTPLIRQMQKYPDITINLFSYQPNPLINDLLNDKIDAGFIFNLDFPGSDELIFHKICREKMILAVSEKHRLSSRSQVSVKEIKNENIVVIKDVQKKFQSKFFLSNNTNPKNIYEAEHIDTLYLTLNETNGIAVVASHIRNMQRKNIAFIDIEESNCYIEMCLAYKRKNDNPAIPCVLSQLDAVFRGTKMLSVSQKV